MHDENLLDHSRVVRTTEQEQAGEEAGTDQPAAQSIPNRPPNSSNLSMQQVMQLQQTIGNQALRRLLETQSEPTDAPTGQSQVQRTVRYRTAPGGKRRYYSSHDPSKSFAVKASAERYDAQFNTTGLTSEVAQLDLGSQPTTSGPVKSTPAKSRKRRAEVDPSLIIDAPRAKKVNVNNLPLHFEDPVYTADAAHAHAGGSHSRAVLGPRSFVDKNSDANPGLPQAIRPARSKYPQASFKAGHLLNATFFGNGQDSTNLTILTASANGTMRAFDERVKDAVRTVEKLYQVLADAYVDVSSVKYGVEVNIKVSSAKWDTTTYPDNCIAKEIICTASKWGGLPDISGLGAKDQEVITDLDAKITAYLNAANAAGTIPNDKPA